MAEIGSKEDQRSPKQKVDDALIYTANIDQHEYIYIDFARQ